MELQAEEVEEKANEYYDDEVVKEEVMKSVNKNVERMKEARDTVGVVYNITAMSSGQEKAKLEEEMKKQMSELKRAQDALSKAIKRNRVTELDNKEKVMTVQSPVKLTDVEFSLLVTRNKEAIEGAINSLLLSCNNIKIIITN